MREYRSEFRPEHGVWVLKRVDAEACEDVENTNSADTVPLKPTPLPAHLRVVEAKPVAR